MCWQTQNTTQNDIYSRLCIYNTLQQEWLKGFACNILILEEAENERMHLMTALELKQPGIIFRGMVLMMQG